MSFLRRLFHRREPSTVDEPMASDDGELADVGIFAGLFVASSDAVASWDIETGLTPPDWPAMEFKRLETVKMGTLESILTGVPYDDIDQDELHDVIRDGGPDGPWIVRLRPTLVQALATMEPSRFRAAGASWADTDEFKARPSDRPSRADVEELSGAISEMAGLARLGQERGEPMFLMMGL